MESFYDRYFEVEKQYQEKYGENVVIIDPRYSSYCIYVEPPVGFLEIVTKKENDFGLFSRRMEKLDDNFPVKLNELNKILQVGRLRSSDVWGLEFDYMTLHDQIRKLIDNCYVVIVLGHAFEVIDTYLPG